MPQDRSFSEVHLDVDPGRQSHATVDATPAADRIFRIAVCGDLRGNLPGTGATSRGHWRVDRDDLDDVLASIAPTVRLTLSKDLTVDVTIRDMEDFHPDRLYEQLPQFTRLRELRARLASPATFRDAAAEWTSPAASSSSPPPSAAETAASLAAPSSEGLLDAIVGGSVPNDAPQSADDLYAFIQRAVAPHLVPREDPRQAELVQEIDQSIATVMRALLHHPAFQALERFWLGVRRLVRTVDTDAHLQIHLVDMPRDAFARNALAAADVRETALFRTLSAIAPVDEGGWSVIVAHHAFDAGAQDIGLLRRLAAIGTALDAAVLAEARPELALGDLDETATASWAALRGAPTATHLALALPRVLLRLPYGAEGLETEHFAFEELDSTGAHEAYCWGSPALFCAALLAERFATSRATSATAVSTRIGGLPMHVTKHAGVAVAKPCAEVLMREDDAMALLDAGFIPMCTLKDQDEVRVPRVHSVADPSARLAGRWL